MITNRDMAILLGLGAVTGVLYGIVVVVADFGRDAFYIGFVVALLIDVIIYSELTDHGEARRFRLLRRRAHEPHRR